MSCGNEESDFNSNHTIKSFSLKNVEIQELKGSKIFYPNILTPKRIIALDNSIIIAEKGTDTLLHLINKQTLDYSYSFGKNGLGPNEVFKIRTLYPSTNNNQFWIYSGQAKKMSLYDLEKMQFVFEYKQQSDDVLATQFAPTYRDTFLGKEADGSNKFSEFSRSGKKVKGYKELLKFESQAIDFPDNVLAYLNQGQLKTNSTLDQFGVASLYRDFIEVLNLHDTSILTINGPYDLEPTFDIDYSAGYPMPLIDFKKSYYCYINMFLGDEFIYALYSGEVMEKVHKGLVYTPSNLFKFNFNGELVKAYKLDVTIDDLYVDEKTKTVYGLSNDENPGLVTYQL
jgi:hypothetical protein